MKLSVYSLKKILFQGNAELLNCKTMVGEITVLDHHEPYIGILVQGIAKVVDNAKKEYFFEVKSGFLQISKNNEVRCIVDSNI